MAVQASYAPASQTDQGAESSPSRNQRRPPTKASATHRGSCWSVWTNDGWWLEIVMTVLGIIFVVVLIVVLYHYDNKKAPEFGVFSSAINFNSVISMLSTAAETSLSYPVAQCIGQLKWVWLSNHRQLTDIAAFDEASRGIIGGFALLGTTKLRSFAVVGWIAMIFRLTISTFSQQLVKTNTVPTPWNISSQAAAPIVRSWLEGVGGQGGMSITDSDAPDFVFSSISTGMKGAIQSGLYSGNVEVKPLTPSCPGVQCSFSSYSSLGVCTSFANVSSHLTPRTVTTSAGNRTRLSLSDTAYIESWEGDDTQYYFSASSASPPSDIDPDDRSTYALSFSDSIEFKDASVPLADVFVIYPRGKSATNHLQYGAVEFIMEWCVQELTTEVVNGTGTTIMHKATRNMDARTYFINVGGMTYSVDGTVHLGVSRYLSRLLQGNVSLEQADWSASSGIAQTLFEPYNVYQNPSSIKVFNITQNIKGSNETGLELIINNIASSMTNYTRRLPDTNANGLLYKDQQIIDVQWKWIAGHGAFIALCVLFLVSTMIVTRLSILGRSTWKSSTLALLHALSPALQKESRGISKISEMEAFDHEQRVCLRNMEDEGWRVVN